MPNLEEHCKHSFDRFGVEGRDIHSWMDEPCRIVGGSHREFRHNSDIIKEVVKRFGDKYGPHNAMDVAIDHLELDMKETTVKSIEKNDVILSDRDSSEVEKSKYEQEKKELIRELRLLRISEIKTSRIRDFIQITYANKNEDLFDLALTSLMDWEKYCLSRENPNSNIEKKDLTGYFNNLFNRAKPLNERTAANYLGFLVALLKHDDWEDLAKYTNDKKKEFARMAREADKNKKPLLKKDVVTLYQSAPPVGKIMIRLLLLEPLIPIQSLERISFIQTSEGKYQFNIDGNIINNINEETIRLAEPLIKENILKRDKRLLDITTRTIEGNILGYAKKVNLSYKVTPKDLRKFGRNRDNEELIDMLRE